MTCRHTARLRLRKARSCCETCRLDTKTNVDLLGRRASLGPGGRGRSIGNLAGDRCRPCLRRGREIPTLPQRSSSPRTCHDVNPQALTRPRDRGQPQPRTSTPSTRRAVRRRASRPSRGRSSCSPSTARAWCCIATICVRRRGGRPRSVGSNGSRSPPFKRLKPGEKKHAKRMATVAAVYTTARVSRR